MIHFIIARPKLCMRWGNQTTNTAAAYEVGVLRMCTVHHLQALQSDEHFGTVASLVHSAQPSTKLGASLAAAVGDQHGGVNFRVAMEARVDKWGFVGVGDLVMIRPEATHGIAFARVDVLFEQIQDPIGDGPFCIVEKYVLHATLTRAWQLQSSREAVVLPVCDVSCSLVWTSAAEHIIALKPDFLQSRIG